MIMALSNGRTAEYARYWGVGRIYSASKLQLLCEVSDPTAPDATVGSLADPPRSKPALMLIETAWLVRPKAPAFRPPILFLPQALTK